MTKFLVVGVETIAGANIAATFAAKYKVAVWSSRTEYEIPNCDAITACLTPPEVIANADPDCIIYCGAAARSAWEPQTKTLINDQVMIDLQSWAHAADSAGKKMVMISSDAVFTGPWLFHDEDSHGQCGSYQAQVIRAAEDYLLETSPTALVIRTNVYGWSPEQNDAGWIESLLRTVEQNRVVNQDHTRHASPILATDLAEIVDRACCENLQGIYHVAGAERVNPLQFTQRLSDRFALPWLAMRGETVMTELPKGFAEGEYSLQTKKIRKELCVAMPLLSEGLDRLRVQYDNGYRASLIGSKTTSEATTARRRVA